MTNVLTGSCLCGACSYEVSGEIRFTLRCFCRDCQHISGGGHMPQLAVARGDLAQNGPVKTLSRKSDSGSDLGFYFCETCGSPMFKTTSRAEELIFLNAGNVDPPHDFEIAQDVFEQSRQPWDQP